MVLENVKEMWTETPRISGGKKGRPVNKDRFISKMWAIFDCYRRDRRGKDTDAGFQVPEGRFGHSGFIELICSRQHW